MTPLDSRGQLVGQATASRRGSGQLRGAPVDAGGGVGVGGVEGFGCEECVDEVFELFAVFCEQLGDFGVGVVDDPAYFLVDQPLGGQGDSPAPLSSGTGAGGTPSWVKWSLI